MASQLVSDVRCQRLMHYALSQRQSCGYHRIRNQSRIQPEGNFKEHNIIGSEEKGAKRSINLSRQQAQKLHQLGFSYLASSFLYIVTKVKAFYKGFLEDVAGESRMGVEAPMAEPYFSLPVLPN